MGTSLSVGMRQSKTVAPLPQMGAPQTPAGATYCLLHRRVRDLRDRQRLSRLRTDDGLRILDATASTEVKLLHSNSSAWLESPSSSPDSVGALRSYSVEAPYDAQHNFGQNVTARRHLGDRLATRTTTEKTFGGSRRQNFGVGLVHFDGRLRG